VGRDLYISGESYAGIYVPYLAMRIHQQNQNAKVMNLTQINLKGILVGNPATDWWVDVYPSMLEMAYMHNIVDTDTFQQWRDLKCNLYFRDVFPAEWDEGCAYILEDFFKNMERINFYDIYRSPYIELRSDKGEKGQTLLNGKLEEYD